MMVEQTAMHLSITHAETVFYLIDYFRPVLWLL